MINKKFIELLIDNPQEGGEEINGVFYSYYGMALELKEQIERLEKLEKAIELLKTRVKMFEIHHGVKSRYYYLYIGGRIVFLSREEYELLKEVLDNGL